MGTIHVADHPILENVVSFDGGTWSFRPSGVSLLAEAVRIADWTDGIPLIATREISGVRRADFGFFPPSTDGTVYGWDAATDGDLIMANALMWVAEANAPTPVAVPLSNSAKLLLAILFAFAVAFKSRRRAIAQKS